MTEKLDLDALEALANAATEGPWEADKMGELVDARGVHIVRQEAYANTVTACDAEFIAAARTAVPALIAELREAHATLERVRQVHRKFEMFEHADSCENFDDDHRDERHFTDADDCAEYYCADLHIGDRCVMCRSGDEERVPWPCPTIKALDGENR